VTRPGLLVAVAGLWCLAVLPAQEVQRHGLVFERWVRDTFFGGYNPAGYTQRWDIPASANTAHGGVPANPKAVKHGTPVDLGDALRQYEISEPFLLIVGFWRQDGDEKRIVNIAAPLITPEQWRRLWAPVTYADLQRLDTVIKDRGLSPEEARKQALKMKSSPPFTQSVIQVNPKIDSRDQRRLQCSIRFADFFQHLAPDADPAPRADPALWGVKFPGPIASKPRGL
jgi:hypothetical protein